MGAVHFGGGDDENAGGGEVLSDGIEKVEGADGVDMKDALGLGPAEGNKGETAEVQDGVGADLGQHMGDGIRIADIERQVGGPAAGQAADIGADDVVSGLAQGGHGMAPDESAATGDEGFHGEGVRGQGTGDKGQGTGDRGQGTGDE